eukprot:5592988-Amphidinium_carterae.1
MSAEKHNIVTIPTGRGVFSVVADHWLVHLLAEWLYSYSRLDAKKPLECDFQAFASWNILFLNTCSLGVRLAGTDKKQ